ncbi:MAG TPA: hypothetical protein VK817_00260 [Trebonia sp.]|jgi:hypothetical protein|nr:hypothetical protein [Trebonia sp.]
MVDLDQQCGSRGGRLVEVPQDSFVEGCEHIEFGGAEQVDEIPARVAHVLGAASSMARCPAGR